MSVFTMEHSIAFHVLSNVNVVSQISCNAVYCAVLLQINFYWNVFFQPCRLLTTAVNCIVCFLWKGETKTKPASSAILQYTPHCILFFFVFKEQFFFFLDSVAYIWGPCNFEVYIHTLSCASAVVLVLFFFHVEVCFLWEWNDNVCMPFTSVIFGAFCCLR